MAARAVTAPIIEVRNLSKSYRLGAIGATTLKDEMSRLWQRLRFGRSGSDDDESTDDEFWALRDVSFDVRPGEVVGIVGRNGAGKSTLLKILSRITQQTSGTVTLRGRVASLLEVGTGFHPDLTGRENVFLNGAILGMTKAEIRSKFDEIVDFAEVERFIDTPVKRYSSGMYVRLAFAVAAHLEPEILIVDEVLAVGDAEFQQKCLGKMGGIASREGRTVIFVSHNTAAVEALCHRAVLLEKGVVSASGDSASVLAAYVKGMSNYTRDLLETGGARHIRTFNIYNVKDESPASFAIGDDIVFETELFSEERVNHPSYGIFIHSPKGERLVGLHTDVQQNSQWILEGAKRLRIIWRNVPLNVGSYRIDLALWDYSSELETLVGVRTLNIHAADVYGSGVLPDPAYMGSIIPDATWSMTQ